jgi:hypothetical protein
MQDNRVGYAMVAVATVAVALFAWMFRYTPPISGQSDMIWDRLTHRECLVLPAAYTRTPGPFCSPDAVPHGK